MDCYQKLRQKLFLILDFDRIGDLSDAVIRREVKVVVDHLVDDRFPHVDENELQAAQQRLKSEIETFTKEKFIQAGHEFRKDLPPPRWRIGSLKWLPVALLLGVVFVVDWIFVWLRNVVIACCRGVFRWRSVSVEQKYEKRLAPELIEQIKFSHLLDCLKNCARLGAPRPICDCCCPDLDWLAHRTDPLRRFSDRFK